MVVEAELISAVSEILSRLGFADFVIRVNHREILRGILDSVGIPGEQQSDVLITLDKLDKIGTEGVMKELAGRGIAHDTGADIVRLFAALDPLDNRSAVAELAEFIGRLEAGQKAVEDLSRLLDLIRSKNVKIDASLARGLSYYTGTIIEVNVPDLAGSLAGGGRYDGLIGMFGKEQIPACGVSLGLERILVVMDERGMFPTDIAESTSADVMVTIWSEGSAAESLKLASELRSKNLRVHVYPEADKLGKQFKYAGQINVPYVCVLGESELAENKVTLKNMQTGSQETISRGEIFERIKL
jgi:histidyl-tRNA synthetase